MRWRSPRPSRPTRRTSRPQSCPSCRAFAFRTPLTGKLSPSTQISSQWTTHPPRVEGPLRTRACCSATALSPTPPQPSWRLDVAQQQFEYLAVGSGGETGAHRQVLVCRGEPDLDQSIVGLAWVPCKFDGTDHAARDGHVFDTHIAKTPHVRVGARAGHEKHQLAARHCMLRLGVEHATDLH